MALKPLTQAEQDAILKAFGGGKAGFKKGASERDKTDKARRNHADTLPKILGMDDVDGIYDTARLLQTTLGITAEMRKQGIKSRNITLEDIKTFEKNKELLANKYSAGVTAVQVIELALDDDIDRSNAQIHTAGPSRYQGNVIHFVTNASKDSDVRQHYVTVRFDELKRLAVSSDLPLVQAKKIAQSKLSFDCDCGRHTFWYRYISTIGNFNSGRPEVGFPKEKNPLLQGIACKHVLRVMHVILMNDIRVIGHIKDMVKIVRKNSAVKVEDLPEHQLSAKEVKDAIKRQAEKAHHDKQQIRRAADNPALQRKIKREAEKFSKAVQNNVQKQNAEIERITKKGTSIERLMLQREMATKLATMEAALKTIDTTVRDIFADSVNSYRLQMNDLIRMS